MNSFARVAAMTQYHRCGASTAEMYCVIALEAGSEIKMSSGLVPFEASLLGLTMAVFSPCLHSLPSVSVS